MKIIQQAHGKEEHLKFKSEKKKKPTHFTRLEISEPGRTQEHTRIL